MKKIFLLLSLSMLLFGCKKDDNPGISFSASTLSLYAGETHQLFQSSSDVNVTSNSDFVASVSPRGLVTANHIGVTEIRSGGSVCNVTVEPHYTLYPDPRLDWGASKAAIKSKLGTPYSETSTSLLYQHTGTFVTGYMFTSDKLSGIGVTVSTSYTSELALALKERYAIIQNSSSGSIAAMYANANTIEKATTIIGAQLQNVNFWTVLYMPNTL